ncbi:hypothetical protein B296_00054659 [Ensete ventricosum]|uniref:Uncharacterized protein n=1 Tax=Ensete ventricosum TaxID=4639 RepID=A0A426Y2Y9_ENSVE|nr:hypothetical protein B296_00054659 [Ensete ventricosum]
MNSLLRYFPLFSCFMFFREKYRRTGDNCLHVLRHFAMEKSEMIVPVRSIRKLELWDVGAVGDSPRCDECRAQVETSNWMGACDPTKEADPG